jgi:hypothetical protein
MAQQFPFISSQAHYPLLSSCSSGKWHLIVLLAVDNIAGVACSSDMFVSTDKTTQYHKTRRPWSYHIARNTPYLMPSLINYFTLCSLNYQPHC